MPASTIAHRTERLFIAFWPDEVVQKQLAIHVRQWRLPDPCVQYQSADWHATLHFIGPVNVDRIPELAAQLDVPWQPFVWVLDQPQLWAHGLAVLCPRDVPEALNKLHDQLVHQLHWLNLPVDSRPYRPHVTLARRAATAIPPTSVIPVVWQVHQFALVVSARDTRQRYRIICQFG